MVQIPSTRTIVSPVIVYTTEEVAAILKTSTRTVQRLIQSGRLKAKRLGHAYRIAETHLQAFVQDEPLPGDGQTAPRERPGCRRRARPNPARVAGGLVPGGDTA
jgi:excisionase family DNA binding protein